MPGVVLNTRRRRGVAERVCAGMRSNLGMNRIRIRVFHFCVAGEGIGYVAGHRHALNILQQVIERLLFVSLIGLKRSRRIW